MIINVKKQARSASFLMACDADARRVAHGTIEVGGSEVKVKNKFFPLHFSRLALTLGFAAS